MIHTVCTVTVPFNLLFCHLAVEGWTFDAEKLESSMSFPVPEPEQAEIPLCDNLNHLLGDWS